MDVNFSRIEKYRVGKANASGFENDDVCRDCAKKAAENGMYVEFDKWAQKSPEDYQFECDFCEKSVFETENKEYEKLKNVIY